MNIRNPTDKREIEVNTDLTSKTYLNEPGYPLCNEDIHIKTKFVKSQSKNGGNSVETQTNLQKTLSPTSPGMKIGSKVVSQKQGIGQANKVITSPDKIISSHHPSDRIDGIKKGYVSFRSSIINDSIR